MLHASSPKSNDRRLSSTIACVFAILAIATLAGCSRSSSKTSSEDKSTSSIASGPSPKSVNIENPVLQIDTSLGPITVRLDGLRAPGTVRNFLNYVNEGFYDNTLVHYVDPGKMIVAGGYAADRTPKPAHTAIRNEAHNSLKNIRGTLAMARDAALIDSATSQFFINLTDAPQRDHTGDTAATYGYCVFGKVTEGLDIAERISKSPTANKGGDLAQSPDPPVVIKSIRVLQ